MNKLVEPVESFLDGSVSQVRVHGQSSDHLRLMADIDEAGLRLSDLFPRMLSDLPDPVLRLHPTIHHDQGEAERDPVSTKYILHFDGSCVPVRPDATLVVAREAGEDAPPTRFVSTTGFLALANSLDIFRNFDPRDVDAVFGYSAYYRHAQGLWLELEPDDPRLQEVIRDDLKRFGADNREQLFEILDADPVKGKRLFPLVSPHSITGEDWIMIDAGVRNIGLASHETGTDREVAQGDLDQTFSLLKLLLADADRLMAEGITVEITPRTGFGVVFSREGLHNQVPPATNHAAHVRRRMSVLGLTAQPCT